GASAVPHGPAAGQVDSTGPDKPRPPSESPLGRSGLGPSASEEHGRRIVWSMPQLQALPEYEHGKAHGPFRCQYEQGPDLQGWTRQDRDGQPLPGPALRAYRLASPDPAGSERSPRR